jgi:hypothetical protein
MSYDSVIKLIANQQSSFLFCPMFILEMVTIMHQNIGTASAYNEAEPENHNYTYDFKSGIIAYCKCCSVHRIVVLALSYDEDERNILYTTKYVTFINLLDGS